MERTTDRSPRIAYDDVGRGEPALLLLPGWCEPRTVFAPLLEREGRRRRTLALDWRGHGDSEGPASDFGAADLLGDALVVLEASAADRIVPVSISHAGWVALELRRRLGPRVEKMVLLDWIVLDPPAPFLDALEGLRDPARFPETREALLSMWLGGCADPGLVHHVRTEMGAFPAGMWARAAREIGAAYAREANPLQAFAGLRPPVPTLHLYSQPKDPAYLAAQESFARDHDWYRVVRLAGATHFPALETPDAVAAAIERILGGGA